MPSRKSLFSVSSLSHFHRTRLNETQYSEIEIYFFPPRLDRFLSILRIFKNRLIQSRIYLLLI